MQEKREKRPTNAETGRRKERFIIENRDRMSYRRMARELGISYQTLLNFVSRHRITTRTPRKWTEEEEMFLIENVGKMTKKEIGSHLGRSYASVCAKYNALPEIQEIRRMHAEGRKREKQKPKKPREARNAPGGKEKER